MVWSVITIRWKTLQAFELKLLVLSVNSREVLERLAAAYRRHFATFTLKTCLFDAYMEDLAHTLQFRRSQLPWKSYFLEKSMTDLL